MAKDAIECALSPWETKITTKLSKQLKIDLKPAMDTSFQGVVTQVLAKVKTVPVPAAATVAPGTGKEVQELVVQAVNSAVEKHGQLEKEKSRVEALRQCLGYFIKETKDIKFTLRRK